MTGSITPTSLPPHWHLSFAVNIPCIRLHPCVQWISVMRLLWTWNILSPTDEEPEQSSMCSKSRNWPLLGLFQCLKSSPPASFTIRGVKVTSCYRLGPTSWILLFLQRILCMCVIYVCLWVVCVCTYIHVKTKGQLRYCSSGAVIYLFLFVWLFWENICQ